MAHYLVLIPLGLAIGAIGTFIGAGGGFLLVPILLLLYPTEGCEIITSTSLAVVFVNALSGASAYARMRRIDYRSGLLFAAATLPGSIAGPLTAALIPRGLFDTIFGVLMILAAVVLLARPRRALGASPPRGRHGLVRTVVEADGTAHTFAYNPLLGVVLTLVIAYLSSTLGIGGGPLQVPMLVQVLNFPVHIATATSQFTLAIMAAISTLVHAFRGDFTYTLARTVSLGLGAVVGAQLGARLSQRVQGEWIVRVLAVALGFVGVRILTTVWCIL